MGHKILAIIKKRFPQNHPLSKIFNKNTVKVSYRCMPNLKSQKDKHNRKILNRGAADQNEPGCNCQKSRKKDCPIPGQCATPFVVYRACVRRHDTLAVDTYTWLTGNPFKKRFTKHKSDINTGKNTASKLSSHCCYLKDRDIQYDVNWSIGLKAPTYNPRKRFCRLCVTEAYHIIFTPK